MTLFGRVKRSNLNHASQLKGNRFAKEFSLEEFMKTTADGMTNVSNSLFKNYFSFVTEIAILIPKDF